MKNYIGIQDDRHRLIDHDHRLNEKVADLQYIVQPQFIAIDAITAGEGRMLTPVPYPMNLVIMGNNQVAFDSVCCSIIGVDPRTVDHIRLTAERGFGPMELERIRISGDVSLAAAQERGRAFKHGLVRVEKYFEGTHITAYAGPPPESEHTDYCWGGCPGAIEEAIEILRLFDEQCDEKMARLHVVFGAYEGPIDARPGEKVVFIGDCARWEGRIHDQLVQIRSKYVDRSRKDPHHARHADIFAKMYEVKKHVKQAEGADWVRFEGCPVSVAEQVLALVELGGVNNPYGANDSSWNFAKNYLLWRTSTLKKRLEGEPYQRPGPCARGQARPDVDATPPAE
jgi:hypothetical protein